MFTDFTTDPNHARPAPPPGCADWTIPQQWERFGAEEHRVWDILFARQQSKLTGRVVSDFAAGLDVLKLSKPGIPDFDELNERLFARTGWIVVAVPGLVPDDVFFRHLSTRRFPAGNFIRPATQLDYLEEPDVFHDVFGHVPMLAQPRVADFVQSLGQLGLSATSPAAMERLSRLYWFTIEFGLALEKGELRIYGAGLASSFGEAGHALESPMPQRLPFELGRVLRTPYRSDRFQDLYFVVESFDRLLATLAKLDLSVSSSG